MYEPQRQENHNIICKQCSTVNNISSQLLNTIICKQCGMFHSLSSLCYIFKIKLKFFFLIF